MEAYKRTIQQDTRMNTIKTEERGEGGEAQRHREEEANGNLRGGRTAWY